MVQVLGSPLYICDWTLVLSRVIHEKSNFKFLTSSSVILFIIVIKYIMQNFSNFEKSLEGATSVFKFCTHSQWDFGDQNVPCPLKSFIEHFKLPK